VAINFPPPISKRTQMHKFKNLFVVVASFWSIGAAAESRVFEMPFGVPELAEKTTNQARQSTDALKTAGYDDAGRINKLTLNGDSWSIKYSQDGKLEAIQTGDKSYAISGTRNATTSQIDDALVTDSTGKPIAMLGALLAPLGEQAHANPLLATVQRGVTTSKDATYWLASSEKQGVNSSKANIASEKAKILCPERMDECNQVLQDDLLRCDNIAEQSTAMATFDVALFVISGQALTGAVFAVVYAISISNSKYRCKSAAWSRYGSCVNYGC
jgi:hypothetical protein